MCALHIYYNIIRFNCINMFCVLSQAVFSGLEEATEYVVTVRAVTAEGEGPWSPRMTINTTREMVRAPMGVKAVATSDQSIQVWWEAVPVRVKINGYRIYYTMTAVEDLNQWNVKDVPATESTDLANLEKMAQYAIAVAARIDNVNNIVSIYLNCLFFIFYN